MEDIKFKKQYGQNFIFDTNLLKAIVNDAQIGSESEVLEIGVGVGSLTKFLSEKAKKVVSYEIDRSLQPKIEENLKNFNNSTVIYKDIMQASCQEINSYFDGSFAIVANLPYYITTPIIFKFLEEKYNLTSLTIMVQKEVGERICAKGKSKDYGILSVMIQSFADVKIVRYINRNMFIPSPNVDSCLVKIDLKNKFNISDREKYRNFIKQCFSMRRKTLTNNLKGFCSKEKLIFSLNSLSLKENIRSEEISIENFVKLYNLLDGSSL